MKLFSLLVFTLLLVSCHRRQKMLKEEQIRVDVNNTSNNVSDSLANSIQGNVSFNQIASSPNSVILTGLADYRLVTIYKTRAQGSMAKERSYFFKSSDYEYENSNIEEHFMPGLDILYGYNLLNIAHFNLKEEKLKYFFTHPALVKTLYYPSFIQDSINKKPVTRNYYLVTVYDEDTNGDTLLNRKDLRRMYCYDANCISRIQIVPAEYSVERSQYDSANDYMYIFARLDENKNGTSDKNEPLHVFWIDLKLPAKAKLLY